MSLSVRRAAGILDLIAAEPRAVAELAEAFDVHRTTMFRELQVLEEVGQVRRRADGRYSLGTALIVLGQKALDDIDLREAAYRHIRRLHEAVGNTLHLAALMGDAIVYVDKVDDAGGVRMYSRVGKEVSPYCTGVGKVVLADLPEARRDAVLAGVTWKRHTATTITSRSQLDAQLDVIARQGYGVDDGEFEDFVNCVAVPIRGSFGIVGALSLTSIRMSADLDALRRHLPIMQATATAIARSLG